MIRGIRGATTVTQDDADEILSRTAELLLQMAEQNAVQPDDIASILFTLSPDLRATFPAEAARKIGWKYVPVICARELDVPHGLPKTVRVLMHAESNRSPREIRHVYLEGAVVLREDLVAEEPQRG
ncbi:chorismate mutase [Sulfobacillus acidophilus TPY]|uniref:chorismate mutase n=1 Tax=Sulfobacillus acidophilus (strain ATCC 700253 / DSM 10332 / NAL) TaxID=679936 RepID=G8TZL2_SULAD|nr:chorismate mutase [Sulfobacillus acidophilus TPY]AEW05252.1 chorismate mutase [Sulfobacillus acidophilus DSM 10332]